MSAALQNIPPVWTALSHWLAVMLYLSLLPHRLRSPVAVMGCSLSFLAAMTAFMWFLGPTDGMIFNLGYLVFTLMTLLPFLVLGDLRPANAVYYFARAFILGGFTASLAWQLYIYFAQKWAFMDTIPAKILTMGGIYALVHLVMNLLEQPRKRQMLEMPITAVSSGSVVLIGFVVYVISSLSFSATDTPFSATTYAEAFNIRTMVYLGGVALLYAHHVQLCESHLSLERDTLKNMLNMQYTNYLISQESVDMVNHKYHDLKHQIAVLRTEIGTERKLDYLDRLEQEISVYETQNKTGNQFLDTILSSKSVHCQKEGIKLTCVADGSALDFMDVMDLSVLFGNALDNAIEAVEQLPDPEQRLIHLSVSREKGFLRIRLENRCREDFVTRKGKLPGTSKLDTRYHGFGLKSITATAAKYNGSATVHAEGGWFELRVLIPLEQG